MSDLFPIANNGLIYLEAYMDVLKLALHLFGGFLIPNHHNKTSMITSSLADGKNRI